MIAHVAPIGGVVNTCEIFTHFGSVAFAKRHKNLPIEGASATMLAL